MGTDQQSPVNQERICNICGDEGFSSALIWCSDCLDTFVHQYCVGITPGCFDDIHKWVCEYCLTSSGSKSPTWNFDDASVRGTSKSCRDYSGSPEIESSNEIVVYEDLPKPLCILLPCNSSSYQEDMSTQSEITEKIPRTAFCMGLSVRKWEEHNGPASSFMECPESIMSDVILLASLSGEILMHRSMNSEYYIHPQIKAENTSPVSSIMVSDGAREPVLLVSPFMEQPKSIMDGLVLLASASGLIAIDEASYYMHHHFTFENSSPDLNSFHEASSSEELVSNYIAMETVNIYGETAPDGTFYTCDSSKCDGMSEVDEFNVRVPDTFAKNMDCCEIQVNESPETDGMEVEGEAYVGIHNSVGSSSKNWGRKRKRSARLSHHPERDGYKYVAIGESNISVECSTQRRKRRKPKDWLDSPKYVIDKAKDMSSKPIDDLRIEIPFETALSADAEKESIVKQISELFRGAHWTVNRMLVKRAKSNKSKVTVFCSPAGRRFWSVAKAYKALQSEVADRVGSFHGEGKMDGYFNVKVSLETALSVGDRNSVRTQVECVLISAGWKIERRLQKSLYVSPEGDAHSSFTKAYDVLQQEVIEGKSKVKAGKAYLNSVKDSVVDMLLRAGWTVKQRHRKGTSTRIPVYLNPEGKCHWNIFGAYCAIQQKAAGDKGEGEV